MGLFDEFLSGNYTSDPDQNSAIRQGLLATGLGLLSSRGNFTQALGQAGMQGMGAYEGAQDSTINRRLKKAQLEDVNQQAALRAQQAAREAQKMAYFFGQQPGGAAPGTAAMGVGSQMGSVGPTTQNASLMGQMPAQQPTSRFGKVPEDIARAEYTFNDGKNLPQMMWDSSKPNIEFQSGVAVDKNNTKAGTSLPTISQNGTASQLIPDPSAPGGYRVILPNGAAQTAAANTIATSLPKALIDAGFKREDFTNPDGTTRSMTGLQFGQQGGGLDALTKLLGPLSGQPQGQPAPQAMPQPSAAPPMRPVNLGTPSAPGGRVPPQTQAARDSDMGMVLQREYADATARVQNAPDPESKARAQVDLAAITKEMQKGKIAPPVTPGSVQSGVSNQQKISNEAQGKINDTWLKSSYEPAISKGDAAKDMLSSVQTARVGLASVGQTGWGKEAQTSAASVLAALGVPQAEKLTTGAQIFQGAAGQRLNAVLNAATGVQTEGDAKRASTTFAKVSNTPKANEFILDISQAVAERDARKAAYYKDALPIAQSKGDLQEVDRRWQKIEPSIWSLPIMQKWKQ